jgi:hypothetical protein
MRSEVARLRGSPWSTRGFDRLLLAASAIRRCSSRSRAILAPNRPRIWRMSVMTSSEVREMSESPWQSHARAAPGRDCVVLLSYLPLRSIWRIPWFPMRTARIRPQLRANSGLIGYSLRAQFAARRFWKLSVWED